MNPLTTPLRFRQVHLDFHTSPLINGIGVGFNKKAFQERLRKGHVNSITLFATCHHGWSYYDAQVGERHPHLGFDLLRSQVDAAREIDVNTPVYLTAGVNNWASAKHPEWREMGWDGRYAGWARNATDAGFHKMCFNTPYLDLLCRQIREVVSLFPDCHGIFLDIISQGPCCCAWCLESMGKAGLKAEEEADRGKHAEVVLEKYYRATTEAVRSGRPDMPVFHNSGHISKGRRELLKYFSHLELESLPTGGWGYDHFPMSAKYCLQLGHDFLGMTGKFHTTWGEFGGYKHPNALRYECAAMIAMGAKCSVGDQLHPCGDLDESTYDLIGAAYAEVEAKEPWCGGVTSIADIGLLSSASMRGAKESPADTGAGRMLLEGHILFDVIDSESEFNPYKALLLPDDIKVDEALKRKLDDYLEGGGRLILSGTSGMNADQSAFLWDVGARPAGSNPYKLDYLKAASAYAPSFCASPLVMYQAARRIHVDAGRSLGVTHDPWFNRSFRHFSSHQHAPYRMEPSGFDCGVMHGPFLYFAHPVFSIYASFGAVAYREYAIKAIRDFLGGQCRIATNLPSTARLTLMDQRAEKRLVLHLLFANTVARGGMLQLDGGTASASMSIEIIEDLLPLRDVRVEVRPGCPVSRVVLEPQGKPVEFAEERGLLRFVVDEFTCHQMVVLYE